MHRSNIYDYSLRTDRGLWYLLETTNARHSHFDELLLHCECLCSSMLTWWELLTSCITSWLSHSHCCPTGFTVWRCGLGSLASVATLPSVFLPFRDWWGNKNIHNIKNSITGGRKKSTCAHTTSYTIFVLGCLLKTNLGLFSNITSKQLTEGLLSDHVQRPRVVCLVL